MNTKKINDYIQLGIINTLRVDRDTEPGLFLMAVNEEVVLLPNIYVTNDMQVGDVLDVFIYTDSEDRIVATTLKPKAMLNEYVALSVVDVMKYGAFMDWGLPKDLLVPKKFQKTLYKKDDIKVIKIVEDKESDRLYGIENFTKDLSTDVRCFKKFQQVNLMILQKTPLGYKVLVSNNYQGLLFDNEIFQALYVGQEINGYIKNIRKDGKLDITLQPIGKSNPLNKAEDIVMQSIKENNNKINFTYKSDAVDIKNTFKISKKEFKKALTKLIQNKSIKLNEDSIEIV